MRPHPDIPHASRGFALPAILVITGALLILAVGALLISGIERSTARSYMDRQRASLAADAALEEVRGILLKHAANDDYLVVQQQFPEKASAASSGSDERKPAPLMVIARGKPDKSGGDTDKYFYDAVPLFSTNRAESDFSGLPLNDPVAGKRDVPMLLEEERDRLRGLKDGEAYQDERVADFDTLPYLATTHAEWKEIRDDQQRTISRYAYWVEDLQGRLDPTVVGNDEGPGGDHARPEWPHPAPGTPAPKPAGDEPPLRGVALFAIDPAAKETKGDQGVVGSQLLEERTMMLSPESMLAAATPSSPADLVDALTPPLKRLESRVADPSDPQNPALSSYPGQLVHPAALAVEESLFPNLRPYLERPLVPFAEGIDHKAAGQAKLNLNRLVATGGESAVNEMAQFIEQALPVFDDANDRPDTNRRERARKGGFPDDYLKTLAAGAIDYADKDSEPTLKAGSFRGLDAYPLLSEIVLHIDFLGGTTKVGNSYLLRWRFKLFAELWNMTNQDVKGDARLSYEVNLQPEPIGATGNTLPFDSPTLLDDSTQSKHNLTKINGKYYGPSVAVALKPDEYRFYQFAEVEYTIKYSPFLNSNGTPRIAEFDLIEQENEARGITLKWNNQDADVIRSIVRDPYGVSAIRTNVPEAMSKAAIPGHSYGAYGFHVNNMGDPRVSHYLRNTRLGENAYPENLSPNRRNIRRETIYDKDPSNEKRRHYGRVMPSEWPDGGHDSPVGVFRTVSINSVLPTDKRPEWPTPPTPLAENAPQRISNLGFFYSATELGHVFDPILSSPAYKDVRAGDGSGTRDTNTLLAGTTPQMPATRNQWPEVTVNSTNSPDYGGGNTLRIGRAEHDRFDRPGGRASQLLDLFHTGISTSADAKEREGNVVRIQGQVNVNTASRDALRALAAGILKQDPELRIVSNWRHNTASGEYRPFTTKSAGSSREMGAPSSQKIADHIADAMVLKRPFASVSEVAHVKNAKGEPVFGNRDLYKDALKISDGNLIQWNDAAAEEVFARVYDASTVRSRHFRVWIVSQALAPVRAGANTKPEVLAETRRSFTVFADPGERETDGSLVPAKAKLRILHERDF